MDIEFEYNDYWLHVEVTDWSFTQGRYNADSEDPEEYHGTRWVEFEILGYNDYDENEEYQYYDGEPKGLDLSEVEELVTDYVEEDLERGEW